jgi:hypothetical protein
MPHIFRRYSTTLQSTNAPPHFFLRTERLVEWVALGLRIPKVPSSNLSHDTKCLCQDLRLFHQFLSSNAGIRQLTSSAPFPIFIFCDITLCSPVKSTDVSEDYIANILVVIEKFSKKSTLSRRQADIHVPLVVESYANFLQNMDRITREAIDRSPSQ